MIVQCKEEDVEKKVTDRLTHSLTNMPHNDPAQYAVLGWVKIIFLHIPMSSDKMFD